MLDSYSDGSLDHMFAHWKAIAVAAVVAVAAGLLIGLAHAAGPNDPTIGEPVVLSPSPSPHTASPGPPSPAASAKPEAEQRKGADQGPDDDGDDLREVERSPQPWSENDDNGDNGDDGNDDADDGDDRDDRDDGDDDDD